MNSIEKLQAAQLLKLAYQNPDIQSQLASAQALHTPQQVQRWAPPQQQYGQMAGAPGMMAAMGQLPGGNPSGNGLMSAGQSHSGAVGAAAGPALGGAGLQSMQSTPYRTPAVKPKMPPAPAAQPPRPGGPAYARI